MSDLAYIVSELRKYRKASHMSQKDLGARLGVTGRTILAWEKSHRLPSIGQLRTWANELGLDIGFQLERGPK